MKKNKKFYNFTDKQRKRDRSLKAFNPQNVGKWLKIRASRDLRRQNQAILGRIIRGDEEWFYLSFVRYRQYWREEW